MTPTFIVFDYRTGAVAGRFKNKRWAQAFRDRKDLEYGAVRYGIREERPEWIGPLPKN